MSDAEFKTLTHLIYHNKDIFAVKTSDLTGALVPPMVIETGNHAPIRQRNYRHSPAVIKEMERQVTELLDAGIVSESASPWCSPTLMVKKAGTTELRLVQNLQKLNSLTKPLYQPVPTVMDVTDWLADIRPSIFSSLDLTICLLAGQGRPKVTRKDRFCCSRQNLRNESCEYGLCQFRCIFSTNSHRCPLANRIVLIYLDDLLVSSKNFDEHISHLQQIFDRLRAVNLKLHPKKCRFAIESVKYLGHIINSQGLSADPGRCAVLKDWPTPKNVKDVKAFLGSSGYYRRYIPRYSIRSAALRELTAKDKKFEWTKAQQDSFDDLKNALTTPPILRFANPSLPFFIQVDSSTSGIGYALCQVDRHGNEYVVNYGGRGLRNHEKRYGITDLECLGLIHAIRESHVYVCDKEFKVITDHLSLKFLRNLKLSPNNRLARWALALQPYRFDIVYKAGKTHTLADGLSRRPYPVPPNVNDLQKDYLDDGFLAVVKDGPEDILDELDDRGDWWLLRIKSAEIEVDMENDFDS